MWKFSSNGVSPQMNSANYWDVFFGMNARFYEELPKHGLSFPFPQLDVHISQNN